MYCITTIIIIRSAFVPVTIILLTLIKISLNLLVFSLCLLVSSRTSRRLCAERQSIRRVYSVPLYLGSMRTQFTLNKNEKEKIDSAVTVMSIYI